jgi:hypothetical protein
MSVDLSEKRVLDWLLEPSQPSIRYLTLTQVMGQRASDPDVRAARKAIRQDPWVREILSRRNPGGWWLRDRHPLYPQFLSTAWNMLALADLGATRAIPEVAASCEYWLAKTPLNGSGVTVNGRRAPIQHACYAGNMVRALIQFGYGDDPRVRKGLEWLVRTAHPKGGWSCWNFGDGPGKGRNLDGWEELSAFVPYPRSKWTPAMKACVGRGAEYFLEKELHDPNAPYPPRYRFHWPVHYFYDVLVGLELLTGLGYVDDPRLGFALDLLNSKRRPDGRWNLDADHPDDPAYEKYFAEHPDKRFVPLSFEKAGRPSKMITLRALAVLARVSSMPRLRCGRAVT